MWGCRDRDENVSAGMRMKSSKHRSHGHPQIICTQMFVCMGRSLCRPGGGFIWGFQTYVSVCEYMNRDGLFWTCIMEDIREGFSTVNHFWRSQTRVLFWSLWDIALEESLCVLTDLPHRWNKFPSPSDLFTWKVSLISLDSLQTFLVTWNLQILSSCGSS